ncbi:hypothetical protein [Thiolapillus sp.]|uniref:hypothetical protein n=1 Tax=Thiolapillus sp. TaxID=2017437 RepID=UPI0025E8773E|nr:hypothetical protein [Thiolapillus sp.]
MRDWEAWERKMDKKRNRGWQEEEKGTRDQKGKTSKVGELGKMERWPKRRRGSCGKWGKAYRRASSEAQNVPFLHGRA